MTENLRLTVDGGKYTYVSYADGTCEVLRYGEPWLSKNAMANMPGGNAWLAMAYELDEARGTIADLRATLGETP